jgi:hypothetical protein
MAAIFSRVDDLNTQKNIKVDKMQSTVHIEWQYKQSPYVLRLLIKKSEA